MNASQLTLIKDAKRLLEDCSCFRGPQGETGPQGSTIVGPVGPQGPAGTVTNFSVVGASTNSLLYYTGTTIAGMSSLFYYSSINTLSANLDVIPCLDNLYNLGSSNNRWHHLYVGPSSIYIGNQAKLYEDVVGNLTTNIGYNGPIANLSSISTSKIVIGNTTLQDSISLDGTLLSSLTINNSLLPFSTLLYDLGNPLKRWRSVYIGPGTINIATTSTNTGTIGTDNNGVVYSQFGFATPFINIGPAISTNNAVGGWRLQSVGDPTQPSFDLVIQQNSINGLTGPVYSLIKNPVYVSTAQLTSSLVGLGTTGYISSSQLTSTVNGLGNIYISSFDNFFPSTVDGLGTFGYVSSLQLQSTVRGLGTTGYISSSQLTSTVNGLGNIYLSSLDNFFPSTVDGLGTVGYISSSAKLLSTTIGLGSAGYISSSQLLSTVASGSRALQSTTTGLGNIYLSSIPVVQANASFGKVLRVDSIYGNDTTALTNQYSYPFSTISVAMYCASTQDQIWLLPGSYNEKVIFKTGVNIRGANVNSAIIAQSNVTEDTTLVKFAQSNRLEDVTLNLTSKTPLASTLIGVSFSSCQETCKLRTVVMNVNNSGITANTVPNFVYGIYSSGHSSTIYNANDNIQRTTLIVTSAGSGKACCIYSDDSNKFSARDVNLFCTDAYNAVYTGGVYYGVETNHSNAIIQIKSSSVNGNAYNGGNYAQDISQTKGEIIVGFTDLVNKTANNNALTVNGTQSIINFGVSGVLSNFEVLDAGPGKKLSNNWSNSFLVPGTLSFTTLNADIITSYNGIRIANTNLITTFGIQAQIGPGVGRSSFAVLYKNGVVLPNFTVPLVGTNTISYLSTSTVTIKLTDTFAVYLSTSSSNTTMSNVVITANFF